MHSTEQMYGHAAIEQFVVVLAFTDLADPTTSCDAPRGCVYVHVYVLSVWSEQASTVSLVFSLVTVQVENKRETNITHLKRSLQTATSKSIWNQNRLLIHISGLIVNVIPKKWTSKCSNLLHLFPFQVTLWISLTFLTPPLQPSDSILVCNILFSQSNQFLMDNIKSCHTFSLWDMSNCVCEMARKSCYMWTL